MRLAGWNASLLVAGLALIAFAGEAWLRLTTPFTANYYPSRFVPGVGVIGKPDAEVRHTNHFAFWTVSRTNSLGFLDREPVAPGRAAASCHVTALGDSLVEAREVAVADKFHVRLEALAARELPRLDVTTSAFGIGSTGQVAQLPFYDEYARHLRPRLLVLVFAGNDLEDNSAILSALRWGWDPERMPHVTAARGEDGKIGLRPPHPDFLAARLARGTGLPESAARLLNLNEWRRKAAETSFLTGWLYTKARPLFFARLRAGLVERADRLQRTLRHAPPSDDWYMGGAGRIWRPLARLLKDPEPAAGDSRFVRDVADMTVFALEQFKARADRDGAAVVILATWQMRGPGNEWFDALQALAGAAGIPVVSQYAYIVRQGGRTRDARWPRRDGHWTPAGHRWAAEALLEWLREHQDVCDPRVRSTRIPPAGEPPPPVRRPSGAPSHDVSAARFVKKISGGN